MPEIFTFLKESWINIVMETGQYELSSPPMCHNNKVNTHTHTNENVRYDWVHLRSKSVTT